MAGDVVRDLNVMEERYGKDFGEGEGVNDGAKGQGRRRGWWPELGGWIAEGSGFGHWGGVSGIRERKERRGEIWERGIV